MGHSMGGLIVRSYLAGLHTDGSLSPPTNPRVRKFIEIATPNFGSFVAWNVGAQSAEMFPASQFLWNLARWNQGRDDLRGVDALAIIGDGGYFPISGTTLSNASDGIVSLTSASLGFSRDPSRTRILPYCHTDSGLLVNIVMDCTGFDTPSGGQISVLGLRFTPPNNALTTIPALANVVARGGSIAHLASGDGWQTTFVLVNAGTSTAQFTLSFFADQTGAPMSLPLSFPQSDGGAPTVAPSVTQNLPAGATRVIVSSGAANLLTGSAQLAAFGRRCYSSNGLSRGFGTRLRGRCVALLVLSDFHLGCDNVHLSQVRNISRSVTVLL